jgi:Ser/Thr protein kinase RdoA (MazF antagonist)
VRERGEVNGGTRAQSLALLQNIIHGDMKPENVLLKPDITSTIGVLAKIT